ncbi:MAG: DUF4388 domain-containing protein [Deltaproteobacteria bacterium]|nr:DUF4388 domain-containing protein [Deltaproteobacteria bacterium]
MTALQGSIKDFGVADIFQLLAQQQKTGVLLVAHDQETAEIYFLNGDLIDVKTARDTERLGAMLVKSALVSAAQYRQALDKHNTTLEHICRVLLNQGHLSRADFERIILAHIYEVIYEMLQWHTGTYRFVSQTVTRTSGLVHLPGLESILLDVLRRIDEWPEIKSVISSFDMLFENNYAALPDLDSDEEHVCALVDGQRSVQDIIDASVLGSFTACKTLVQLLERGAIRLLSKRAEKKADSGNLFSRAGIGMISFGWLAAVAALLLFLPGSFLESTFPVAGLPRWEHTPLRQAFVRDHAKRLERALEIHRLTTGAYPETLRSIVDHGILSKQEIASIHMHAIAYKKTGGSYDISIAP